MNEKERERINAYNRQRQRKKKERRECVQCSRPAAPMLVRCELHAAQHRDRMRARNNVVRCERHAAEERERVRARRKGIAHGATR